MNSAVLHNTTVLYIRTFFSSLITIWSIRILSERLGLTNYGILNVILGLSVLIGSIQQALSTSGQKFITEATLENGKNIRDIFMGQMLVINVILAAVILLIGYTAGEYFITEILTIPKDRMTSSIITFRLSLVLLAINIVLKPFTLLYFSYDDLSLFGILGILESLMKLILAYALIYFDQRLEWYLIGLIGIALLVNLLYVTRSVKKFDLRIRFRHTHFPFKQFLLSVGWNFIGSFSNTLSSQGQNLLLNIYFGPIANSARAISVSVKNTVYLFASNIQLALNSSVVRESNDKNLVKELQLLLVSTRIIFGTVVIVSLPLIIFTEEIFKLWLVDFSWSTVIFTRLILIELIIHSLSVPSESVMVAKDKLYHFQTIGGVILLSNLLISYPLLVFGGSAQIVYLSSICTTLVVVLYRLKLVEKVLEQPRYFIILKVISMILKMTSYSIPLVFITFMDFDNLPFFTFVLTIFSVFCYLLLGSALMLLRKEERQELVLLIRSRIQ